MSDNKCKFCHKKFTEIPFKCKFCNKMFCSDHRLPEKHDCKGLRDYNKKKSKTYYSDKFSTKTHKIHHNKSFNHRKITSPLGKFFKGIWKFIVGIFTFIYGLIIGIISFITGSIWGLIEFVFGALVLFLLLSLFIPSFSLGGLFGLAMIDEGIDYTKGLYYDAKDFIVGFRGNEISEECKNKILALTPEKLKYESYFINSGFEFKWRDGVKTEFKEGFKLEKGEKEGQNINYYYPNREFEYSKKVVDSNGVILGEDKFRAELLFQPTKQNMIMGMGTIEFKVVNITPTYCNFYDLKEASNNKNVISEIEIITDFKDINRNPENYIGKTLIIKGESDGTVNLCGGAVLTDRNGYKVYVSNSENRALGKSSNPITMTFEGRFTRKNNLGIICYQLLD